ncbi:HEPN domain-containing protein [Paraburkholderia phenazinium]|uniref:ApeA N-terminal domain 1-containing protein n=1 Tax=Paraburkholderia phenazinium TaxID=60549 RepID=UPI00158A4531|nr:HEPN domain-containing protein [Paraburkholderia phenazinium]
MIFIEEHKHSVEFHHDELGSLGDGKLFFGGGQQVSGELPVTSPIPHSDAEYSLGVVYAIAENGKSYTLHGCKAYGFTIYADYLVVGNVPDTQFQRVIIRYSDISEWFLQWRRIEGKVGEKLTWFELPRQISVDFTDEQRQFKLTTEYEGDLTSKGENHVLHEHVEFAVEQIAGALTLDDARSKAMEVACLLSILIAHPVSIVGMHVQSPDSNRFHRFYFPTFQPASRDTSDSSFIRGCFTQKHALDGRWQTIFQNYYRSSHRKVRWTRLAGMQRYEGFWEYKTLGYVSLLDSYVSHYAGRGRKSLTPPNPQRVSALEAELEKISPKFDQSTIKTILDATSRTFSSSQEPRFPEKYQATIAATDADIVKIINISDQDFRLIKKVRDRIAHGQDIGLEDGNLTRISTVVSRIELLLTYWAYIDFGLSKADFLRGLNNPLCRLRRLSQIDAKHFARVSGTAEFFEVSDVVFRLLSSRKGLGVFPCFLEGPNRQIEFSDHFQQKHLDWHNARHRGVFTSEQIFDVNTGVVRNVPHLFIECGDESLEFHGAFIFDRSRLSLG